MDHNFIGVSYLSPSTDVVCKAKQSYSLSPIGSPLPDVSPSKPQASSVKSYDLFCSNSPEMANLIDLNSDFPLPGHSPVMRAEYCSAHEIDYHYVPEIELMAKLETWALTPPLTPPASTPVLSVSPKTDPSNMLYNNNHQDQPWIDEWLMGMGGMEMDPNLLEPRPTSLSASNIPPPNWLDDDFRNLHTGFLSPDDLLYPQEYPYPNYSPSSSGSVSPHHKYEDDPKLGGNKLLPDYYALPSPIEIPVHKKAQVRSVKHSQHPPTTTNPAHPTDRILRYSPYDGHPVTGSSGTQYRINNGNSMGYSNNVPNSEPDGAPYLVKPGFISFVSPAAEDILMDGKCRSRSAPGEALLRQKSAKSLSPIHHYKYRHKAKMARYRRSSNKEDLSRFELVIERVVSGQDTRTTLMIKNIPNKYDQEMLLEAINQNFKGSYDFFYLPIDFKNKCNVGYAFINFIHYLTVANFYSEFNLKKWEKFNSEKVCHITFARIQGKLAFIDHFRNSSLMNEDPACRPLIFHSGGPNMGLLESFPPANVRMGDPNTDSL